MQCNSTVLSVAFSFDGRTLAAGGVCFNYINLILWNVLAFSPNKRILASASGDSTIKLWDISTGQHILTLQGHEDSVTSVAFSPDGDILASGSKDTTIKLWG